METKCSVSSCISHPPGMISDICDLEYCAVNVRAAAEVRMCAIPKCPFCRSTEHLIFKELLLLPIHKGAHCSGLQSSPLYTRLRTCPLN